MKRAVFAIIAASLVAIQSAWALKPGDPAPDFRAMSTTGEPLSLSDFAGRWLVLYFYPKAFTPGCTTQSCSLRDGYSAIIEQGAVILGASTDTLETQRRFKKEHRLPFELLADSDAAVARAYGVSALMGSFARRVTFIISPEGKIARVIEDVRTGSHDAQVLEALKQAQSGISGAPAGQE